jgi:lysophospholipase L1-like esterase
VPRRGWLTNSAEQDAVRAEVNTFIRTSPIFDEVLDIAAAVGLPGDDNLFQPRYDSGDHLHPNTAGYQAIAESLNLRFLKGN